MGTLADVVDLVILDRVVEGQAPPQYTCGATKCAMCKQWVYLGDKTLEMVANNKVPICLLCAAILSLTDRIDIVDNTPHVEGT